MDHGKRPSIRCTLYRRTSKFDPIHGPKFLTSVALGCNTWRHGRPFSASTFFCGQHLHMRPAAYRAGYRRKSSCPAFCCPFTHNCHGIEHRRGTVRFKTRACFITALYDNGRCNDTGEAVKAAIKIEEMMSLLIRVSATLLLRAINPASLAFCSAASIIVSVTSIVTSSFEPQAAIA